MLPAPHLVRGLVLATRGLQHSNRRCTMTRAFYSVCSRSTQHVQGKLFIRLPDSTP